MKRHGWSGAGRRWVWAGGVGAAAAVLVALWGTAVLHAVVPMSRPGWDRLDAATRAQAEGQFRLAAIQGLAALGAGFALVYTARNFRLNRRGQVTERFTNALERLGSDLPYVRSGGVFALEQIVQDAPEQKDHITRILVAFLRDRAPAAGTTGAPDHPAPDVQTALTTLALLKPAGSLMDLSALHLRGANLACADLHGASLTGADLTDAALVGADLRGASLTGAKLRGAFLHDADLTGAALVGADLRGANLTGANLTGANLCGADLRGAKLRGANLSDADLTDADLCGAKLPNAKLPNAKLPNADLRDADLRDANLTGADLTGAQLPGADLTGAQLPGADLTGADLTGADLRSTDLNDANLTGAQLRGMHLNGAVGDEL